MSYCGVHGSWSGHSGGGNINDDPEFVDHDGPVGVPGTEDGGLHLLASSPCIDAGSPCTPVAEEPSPNGCRINMGAYGGTVEATKSAIFECFPSMFSSYDDWLALDKLCCWCWWSSQCDGDADYVTQGARKYKIYTDDLTAVINNWKKKIDDPEFDPCADFDHKGQGARRYRVYTNEHTMLINDWKKTDAELPGNCPRAE